MENESTNKTIILTNEQINNILNEAKKIHDRHFFCRNKPRRTLYLYSLVVSAIGYQQWADMFSPTRSAWESARKNFDMMYGLLEAWSQSDDGVVFYEYPDYKKEEAELKESKKELDAIKNDIQKFSELTEYVSTMKDVAGDEDKLKEFINKVIKESFCCFRCSRCNKN